MGRNHNNCTIDVSVIRGELRVLKISVITMIIFAVLSTFSIFRLLGVPGIQHILLISFRVLDIIVILAFLMYCGSRIRVRKIDILLLAFTTYPLLIGVGSGNLSITFMNDFAIFSAFVCKTVILRTILSRISEVIAIDAIFMKPANNILFWCSIIGLISIATVNVLFLFGARFYYQAPSELTFAAAIALSQGKFLIYLGILVLSILSGKRMIMIGVLFMGLWVAVFSRLRMTQLAVRLAIVIILPLSIMMISDEALLGTDMKFLEKIAVTFQQLQRSFMVSESFLDILMYADPARYAEYFSLKPHLTGWALWFGNGYGFRYELDADFLSEFGYAEQGSVTNAHFTPLAIVAKFGLVGFGIWVAVIGSVLASYIDRRSFAQRAAKLAFISILLQSLFAFGFFLNVFTPFYIAMITHGRQRRMSNRRGTSVSLPPLQGET